MSVLARKTGEEGDPSPLAMGEVRGSLDMRDGAKLSTARQLRRDEAFAEKRLWGQLRNRTLDGFKFVRQAPAGPYIADFLCRENKLIIEVDGATHSSDAEIAKDANRSRHLTALGYRVIRFHNDEIVNGLDEVLTLIVETLSHRV